MTTKKEPYIIAIQEIFEGCHDISGVWFVDLNALDHTDPKTVRYLGVLSGASKLEKDCGIFLSKYGIQEGFSTGLLDDLKIRNVAVVDPPCMVQDSFLVWLP